MAMVDLNSGFLGVRSTAMGNRNFQRYDIQQDYAWNYQHAPDLIDLPVPDVPGRWIFLGKPVASPLGISAGPLLNGKWILYYAKLGFDVLTYKTVRSTKRDCYELPNLTPVNIDQMTGQESELSTSTQMLGSWAVSFGMPSAAPEVWRKDIEWTRDNLSGDQILSVSVVGTIQAGWSLTDLAEDYAQCARWAVESGADCIETNFSCPNVSTADGQLYQECQSAAVVAESVRQAIGDSPYLIKIGHQPDCAAAAMLLNSVAPYVDGLAMTNSIATTVKDEAGQLMFDGQPRGICGDAIRTASIQQTKMFSQIIQENDFNIKIVGVGGIHSAEHVKEYLNAGAESVQLATAVMTDPEVGTKVRSELAG